METGTHSNITKLDCFVCGVARGRVICLNGRKSKEHNFLEKLKLVLNNNDLFASIVNSNSPLVCRNCYRKVEQTYDFILQLKTSVSKYVTENSVPVKWDETLPATPESMNPEPQNAQPNCLRKKLKLMSPAKQVQNPTPSDNASNIPFIKHATLSSTCISLPDHGYSRLVDGEVSSESTILSNLKALLQGISAGKDSTSILLRELRTQSSTLTSRLPIFCSVLYKYRNLSKLEDNIDHFQDEIIAEMMKRVPLLLKVMLCVATPESENMKPSILPAIASAYSILMKHKYDNLSAYHRLTTIIAVNGGLDERHNI
ncbi:uncharacterized protein LOC127866144 isoform X2 [Dreissena polymorpha]|uniref:uncharacterized protein LOC127866144 isoform X2 n=1 Tax=Dreissena polymorpha TaxID=45954 RepID=UPI002264EFEB|nr:uncharacterized protein LOC127866144 isoform X2 [Dreissena polymorpha]